MNDELLRSKDKEIARQHKVLTYLAGLLLRFNIDDWYDETQIENAVAYYNAGKPRVKTIYLIWELHNKVEPRLLTAYFSKEKAEMRVNQLKEREGDVHDWYIKPFEVRE